jgi:O-antigen/teichoic acid export membrane protein
MGASYAVVAVALVLVVDLLNPTFAPELDFVLSAAAGALLAGSACWWRGAERAAVTTRRRSAAVGAVVGFVSPTLAFALNPSLYGSSSNLLVEVVGGVVAAGILGLQAQVSTFAAPVAVGALAGWSLGGWLALLRTDSTDEHA